MFIFFTQIHGAVSFAKFPSLSLNLFIFHILEHTVHSITFIQNTLIRRHSPGPLSMKEWHPATNL
jgi:hypothetical protein